MDGRSTAQEFEALAPIKTQGMYLRRSRKQVVAAGSPGVKSLARTLPLRLLAIDAKRENYRGRESAEVLIAGSFQLL
jgi:hypothetical protein